MDFGEQFQFPGYSLLEVLHNSAHTIVFRAARTGTNESVVLKSSKEVRLHPRLRSEYALLQSIHHPNVITALGLTKTQSNEAIVLEDFDGITLREFSSGKAIAAERVLEIMLKVVRGLDATHNAGICHNDMKPGNIVYNPSTGVVKLIDFGLAKFFQRRASMSLDDNSVLGSELLEELAPGNNNNNLIAGTFAYLAPERTGRLDHTSDHRADFYAVGVTLFELLTGRLPFMERGNLAVVHAHLAQEVPSITKIVPSCPRSLELIAFKLMAKSPDERYQSTVGLLDDLEKCSALVREARRDESKRNAVFTLGQNDAPCILKLPNKLYGRDSSLGALAEAAQRAALQHTTQIVMVSGEPGIGKSALVFRFKRQILGATSVFISGKYFQYNSREPYSAIHAALNELSRQLLTPSLEPTRLQLRSRLAADVTTLSEFFPQLAPVFGRTASTPVGHSLLSPVAMDTQSALPPAQAETKLKLALLELFLQLSTCGLQVVLFLDDVQWADPASFRLLDTVVSRSDLGLCIVCAYRDREVDEVHPLTRLRDRLREEQYIRFDEISLMPLQEKDIEDMLMDVLSRQRDDVSELARFVLSKTAGNPLFVNWLVGALYEDGHVYYDMSQRMWVWTLEKVQAGMYGSEVVEFISDRLKQLSAPTRLFLQAASCVGTEFAPDLVTDLLGLADTPASRAMVEAMAEGVVLRLRDQSQFAFIHDRIQQVLYQSVSEEQRHSIHWRVGTLWYSRLKQVSGGWSSSTSMVPQRRRDIEHEVLTLTSDSSDNSVGNSTSNASEALFETVNHLNAGVSCMGVLPGPSREELASLNETAGTRALKTHAFNDAVKYLQRSLALLGDDAWEKSLDRAFEISLGLATALYMTSKIDESEDVFRRLQQLNLSDHRKYRVAILRSCMLLTALQLDETVNNGLACLRMLGLDVPLHPSDKDVDAVVQSVDDEMNGRSPEEMVSRLNWGPENEAADEQWRIGAILNFTADLVPSVFFTRNSKLMICLTGRAVALSMQRRYARNAAVAWVTYGFSMCSNLQRRKEGCALSKMGVMLARHQNDSTVLARALHYYSMISSFNETLDQSISMFEEAFTKSREAGDLNFSIYASVWQSWRAVERGTPIPRLLKLCEQRLPFMRASPSTDMTDTVLAVYRLARKLSMRSRIDGAGSLPTYVGPMDPESFSKRVPLFCLSHLVYEALYCWLDHDLARAVDLLMEAEDRFLKDSAGMAPYYEFHWIAPIVYGAEYRRLQRGTSPAVIASGSHSSVAVAERRVRLLSTITRCVRDVSSWADASAANYCPKVNIAVAEQAYCDGDTARAGLLYSKAVKHAVLGGFEHIAAIVCELSHNLYRDLDMVNIAEACLRDSVVYYDRWGAADKVSALLRTNPSLSMGSRRRKELTSSGGAGAPNNEPLTAEPTGELVSTSHTFTDAVNLTRENMRLDLTSVLKALHALSEAIELDTLLEKLVGVILENSGADNVWVMLLSDKANMGTDLTANKLQDYMLRAEGQIINSAAQVRTTNSQFTDAPDSIQALLSEVVAVKRVVIQGDLSEDTEATPVTDEKPAKRPQSACGFPISYQGRMIGLCYLHNTRVKGVFNTSRMFILQLLSTQIAIAIQNARLYSELKQHLQSIEKANARLAEANARLKHLDKMKDNFLANTSHELRTPLHGIIGITESLLVEQGSHLPANVRDDLVLVSSSGKYLLSVTNDILDFSYLREKTTGFGLNLAPVSITTAVRTAVDLASRAVNHKPVTVKYSFPGLPHTGEAAEESSDLYSSEGDWVNADPLRLQQILINLLGNAIKFTDVGFVEVVVTRAAEMLSIAVKDTGCGISEASLNRIWESFEQGDGSLTRAHGGTGLGLAITRRLVELHSGAIEVTSTLGVGSTFTFTMPRCSPPADTSTVAATADSVHGRTPLSSPTAAMSSDDERPTKRHRTAGGQGESVNLSTIAESAELYVSSPELILTRPENSILGTIAERRLSNATSTSSHSSDTSPSPSPSPKTIPAPEPEVPRDLSARILLVDDNPINLRVLQRMLAQNGYRNLVLATGGVEALRVIFGDVSAQLFQDHVKNSLMDTTSTAETKDIEGVSDDVGTLPALPVAPGHFPSIDLVLLDVMMPYISGLQVLRVIRHHFTMSEVPVALLTARTQISDITRGYQLGANDYLTKPLNMEDLVARVRRLLWVGKVGRASGQFVPRSLISACGISSVAHVRPNDFYTVSGPLVLARGCVATVGEKAAESQLSMLHWMSAVMCSFDAVLVKTVGDCVLALFPDQYQKAVNATCALLKGEPLTDAPRPGALDTATHRPWPIRVAVTEAQSQVSFAVFPQNRYESYVHNRSLPRMLEVCSGHTTASSATDTRTATLYIDESSTKLKAVLGTTCVEYCRIMTI